MNQVEMEHLKRITDICANRGEAIDLLGEKNIQLRARIAELTEETDRANLRIIAKNMQIAELTRMLFSLGKQDGQTIRTQAAETERLKDALLRITHTSVTLGNNQSAWEAWRLCATIANEAIK